GPGGKMLGRMQQVLHSMHDGRLIDTFQIEYCLETQGVAAIAVQVHAEPDAEGRPVQGRFPLETDGADASVRRAQSFLSAEQAPGRASPPPEPLLNLTAPLLREVAAQ